MKRLRLQSALLLALVFGAPGLRAQVFPFLGGDRVGISALASLKVAPDARGAALAESMAAIADDPTAAFWNPAMLTESKDGAMFSYNEHLAGNTQSFVAAHYAIDADNHVGLSMMRYGVPDMKVTTETQPFGTGQTFKARDVALGLSYARRFTDQFSAGVTLRYAGQSVAELESRALLADLGTIYKTGLGSLRFAVAVQNFGSQIRPAGSAVTLRGTQSEFDEFYPPTVFTIGFGYELIEDSTNRLTTALALNHPNDNSENITIGAEYSTRPVDSYDLRLSARAGYKINADDEDFSAGAGLELPAFGASASVDYSYTHYTRLGGVQRITAGIRF